MPASTLTTTKSGERSEVTIHHAIRVTESRIIDQLEITPITGNPYYVGQLVAAFCANHSIFCALGRTILVHSPKENTEFELTKFLVKNDVVVIIPPMELTA